MQMLRRPVQTGLAALMALASSPAWAEGAAAAQDLSRYKEESVPGGNLMLIAYMVLWALLGAYAVRTALRQSRSERDLAALQDRLDRLTGSPDRATPNPSGTEK